MTKKRSRNLFIVLVIILVIGIIATFVNFTYPFTVKGSHYSYSSFISNIRWGEDIGSSLRLTYDAKLPDGEVESNYNDMLESTKNRLKDIVQSENYKDVTVASASDKTIIVTVGNLITDKERDEIISLIGAPAKISFSLDSSGANPFAGGAEIGDVKAISYSQSGAGVSYVVSLEFKDEYKDLINSKSKESTIYIFLGGNQFASLDYSSQGGLTTGIIYLQSDSFETLLDAKQVANQIKVGMLALDLTIRDTGVITATYGGGEMTTILVGVVMIIFVVACLVYMIVRFRHLGLVGAFAMQFYTVIGLLLIQSIPLAHINFAGVIGILISFLVTIDILCNMFARAKVHYNSDVKLYIALKLAEKDNLMRTVILNVLMCATGLVCLLMPSLHVQSFGWAIFILSFVSAFVTLALMRLFIRMYLPFNSENGAKCNFHKGGKNA